MKTNIIHLPKFTSKARERWDKISNDNRAILLDNVWCGKCLDSVSMILENAKVKTNLLILEGVCKICGSKIVRVIEPE